MVNQYKVYLFERILLCCKEINPNKPKKRPTTEKKGKLRLQLKGRIFMQNVTEIISIQKPGSYTIQIFWKGDPGVENFVIRFANEEIMRKWSKQVDVQRKLLSDGSKGSKQTGTSETEFTYLKNQGALMENPYREEDTEEDDVEQAEQQQSAGYGEQSEFTMSRNASSTSLRARSATGGSGPSLSQGSHRAAPQRFGLPENHGPSLTLHTQFSDNGASPAERIGNSYFSPTVESPVSFRSSAQSNTYPFPRQATPSNGWPGDDNRFTAPAMGGQPSRDGPTPTNGYYVGMRTNQRPSLPAMTASQSAQQLAMTQSRMRSASSPDIHNNPNLSGARRYPNGQLQPPIDNIPVPPIPAHMTQMRTPVNRSQNSSPSNGPNSIPTRAATQSPGSQRERLVQHNYVSHHGQQNYEDELQQHTMHPDQYTQFQQQQAMRHNPRQYLQSANTTPAPCSTMDYNPLSAPLSATSSNELPTPNQLKVKLTLVEFDAKHVTLVVPSTITYRTLIDRIDAKLKRTSDVSIAGGTARLRYQDVDKDYLRLDCDEDVQGWIIDWKEKLVKRMLAGGDDAAREIELFCSRIGPLLKP
ncbi:MAG: hypothetical protein M1830_007911 [Pleopsidium flavum]|nr:MAG: hypothetical protein M1830_007911 [Pleopsidium flavum]